MIARLSPGGTVDLVEAYAWPPLGERSILRVNFVTSLDGSATYVGHAGGLSSPEDQHLLGLLRRLADVVLVGAGTVRIEGYGSLGIDAAAQEWRVANGLSPHPPLAIVSHSLDLPPSHHALTRLPARSIVITHASADPDRLAAIAEVADVLVCGTRAVDLPLALAGLAERGLRRIVSEGGPRLLGTLLAEDLVDELCLTLSPRLVAGPGTRIVTGPALDAPRRMSLVHALSTDDGELFLRYARGAAARA